MCSIQLKFTSITIQRYLIVVFEDYQERTYHNLHLFKHKKVFCVLRDM